jgi:uncharacterized protein (TIGR03437 family)
VGDSRRCTNAPITRKAAVVLACAASLFAIPARSAINGVSAPRLLLSCLNFQQSGQTTVVSCQVTNVSSTSGGQAPVIQNLELLVGASVFPMSPASVSSGGPPSYSGSLTFPGGSYQKGIDFSVEGVAVDGIFSNTAGLPPGTQYVTSNSLQVTDSTQPPAPNLPGNCTYEATLSSTPLNFPAEGGNAYIVVDTETVASGYPGGCPWAPSTHDGAANVVTFTGRGAVQTGPGEATFQVLPNLLVNGNSNPLVIVMPEASGTPNAADIIAGTAGVPGYHGSFQFTQDGLTCAYTASGFAAPQSGLSATNPGIVTITATGQTVTGDGSNAKPDTNCEWQVTGSSSQVTIVGGDTTVHTGTGTFQFYVSANTSATARTIQFSLGTLVFQTSQPGVQANVNVTLASSPAGLSLVADGTSYTAPHTFQWSPASQHAISIASPQGTGGTQYTFASWSQGGSSSQTIAIPAANATYTANFTTSYQLTTAVSPAGSGTVTPASGAYYAAGSAVDLAATADSGYTFTNWSGAVSSSNSASTTIVMSGPESVTATFSNCDILHEGVTNVADVQSMIKEALGLTSPANDLSEDGIVNALDIQIVINASLNLGCSATGTKTTNLSMLKNPALLNPATDNRMLKDASTGFTNHAQTAGAAITAPTALPVIATVVSAASLQNGPVSPGEVVSIFGTGLGSFPASAGWTLNQAGKVATSLGGVQVSFNGIDAALIYVSATRINCVVPQGIQGVVSPYVQVTYHGQPSTAFVLTSASAVPALFTSAGLGNGPAAAVNQDGSYNSPTSPAAKGSTVVLFVTGEGQTSPAGVMGKVTALSNAPPVTPHPVLPVRVLIGGQSASVASYGEAPGLASGVVQLAVQIPLNVPSGNLPISVSVGGDSSPTGVTISVQ